jgi:hypothetical protein
VSPTGGILVSLIAPGLQTDGCDQDDEIDGIQN